MLNAVSKSVVSILTVQGINFAIPLLALPHLTRALGVSSFATYSIILSYGNYVLLISEYSFNVNGPIYVSDAVTLGQLRGLIFESTLLKLCLLVVPCVIFVIAVLSCTDGGLALAISGVSIPIATTLIPRWIMYSLAQIHYFAVISLVTKGGWLAFSLLSVQTPDDLSKLLWITGLTQALAAIGGLFLVWRMANGTLALSVTRIISMFRRDFTQFAALLGGSSLRDLGVIVMSAAGQNTSVGYFSVADRVRFAIMGIVAPVSQSLFLVSARYGAASAIPQSVRGQINLMIVTLSGLAGLVVAIFSPEIIDVLAGNQFGQAVPILRILAIAPVFVAINSALGVNTLLLNRYADRFARIQLLALSINAPMYLVLTFSFGAIGASGGIVVSEVIYSLLLARECKRHNLLQGAFRLRPQ